MVRLLERRRTDILPLFVLVTAGIQIFMVLLMIFQGGQISRLANTPAPSLVQLVDGRAIQVSAKDHLEREPETIRRFVSDVMTMLFTWSGTLPPQNLQEAKVPRPDPGVEITSVSRGNDRIATQTWESGFALSEDFRKEFLQSIAVLTPPSVFGGTSNLAMRTQSLLIVRNVSEPRSVTEGKRGDWVVSLVANLVILSSRDPTGNAIAFNKEIFLRAVDTPELPLPDAATPIQQAVYRMRQAGLEIYKIRDLDLRNL